jgi:hypothetical protein
MEKWPWYLKALFIVVDVCFVVGLIFISCHPGCSPLPSKSKNKPPSFVKVDIRENDKLCNGKTPWAITVTNNSTNTTVNKVYIKSEAYEEGSSKNLFNNDVNSFGIINWRYIVKPGATVTKCFELDAPSNALIKITGVEPSFYEGA